MSDASSVHISALQQGDQAAFMQVFHQHHKPLLYFAKKIVLHHEVAEECVSDCFIKLWQIRERFASTDKVKAFLYISVKNACLNYIKSPHARQTFQAEPTEELLSEQPAFFAQMIQAELMDAIYREIDQLPEKQRLVFRMSYLEGATTADICAALDMTPAAVFTNRSRATETLKKVFKDRNALLYLLFLQWMAG
ncbi:RNA polymerase sigma factor [Paraflavitalea pollutisoli]|uniref:RNA polymerase sigma factor n=1 Tax=Paraflavitalea pollutisoli TaxID=3034143 RepID=UPI0023EC8961|nr:RNA polymerase sigma-70 factor [Paraflavitalea sp. H1-2-19X]